MAIRRGQLHIQGTYAILQVTGKVLIKPGAGPARHGRSSVMRLPEAVKPVQGLASFVGATALNYDGCLRMMSLLQVETIRGLEEGE